MNYCGCYPQSLGIRPPAWLACAPCELVHMLLSHTHGDIMLKRGVCLPEQAWQTIHPPRRGRGLRRPKVHIGFHKSWVANDLHLRIKERVMEIIKDHKGTTKLYITGKSLLRPCISPVPVSSHPVHVEPTEGAWMTNQLLHLLQTQCCLTDLYIYKTVMQCASVCTAGTGVEPLLGHTLPKLPV